MPPRPKTQSVGWRLAPPLHQIHGPTKKAIPGEKQTFAPVRGEILNFEPLNMGARFVRHRRIKIRISCSGCCPLHLRPCPHAGNRSSLFGLLDPNLFDAVGIDSETEQSIEGDGKQLR